MIKKNTRKEKLMNWAKKENCFMNVNNHWEGQLNRENYSNIELLQEKVTAAKLMKNQLRKTQQFQQSPAMEMWFYIGSLDSFT